MSVISTSNDNPTQLTGGAGDDTLVIRNHGADTLTGGAGSDTFQFDTFSWANDLITDFTPGVDKLDISTILHSDGYSGSNPIADGWLFLQADGHGGTQVAIDQDGPGPVAGWADRLVDIEGVAPSAISLNRDIVWQSNLPSTAGPPGSTGPGQLISASSSGSTLVGTAGDDTLVASAGGGDTLTGGAGADVFRLPDMPSSPVVITDFTIGTDQLDLRALAPGYHGTDPINDGYLDFGPDGSGGTDVWVDPDGPGPQYESIVADLQGVAWTTISIGRDLLIGNGDTGADGAGLGSSAGSGGAGSGGSGGGSGSSGGSSGGGASTTLYGGETFSITQVPSSPDDLNGFTPGSNKLDLSALFDQAGYHGKYPGHDGYLSLTSDGQGGTDVWFNPSGGGGTNGSVVADLGGVSASSINVARDINFGQFGYTSASSPPSSSGSSSASGGASGSGAAGETLSAPANDTGVTLTGGPGNDTLIAGNGPDNLYGGGGSDTFVFNTLPYNSGHVADFNPATDVLDLSGIANAYHYAGTDPIADGWLILRDDGHGDTQVFVNTHDGSPAHIITVLEGVPAASLHPGDWLF